MAILRMQSKLHHITTGGNRGKGVFLAAAKKDGNERIADRATSRTKKLSRLELWHGIIISSSA
jgi:hypothetical protein